MRWLALPFQIVIPGAIGLCLTLVMTSEFGAMVLTIGPALIPAIVILGGAVIGFLAWLPGLIVDQASLGRLRLTVILSILAVTASFLPIVVVAWDPRVRSPLMLYVIDVAAAAPLAGAMTGYYWLWRAPHTEGQ
jgi:hypothetical protein